MQKYNLGIAGDFRCLMGRVAGCWWLVMRCLAIVKATKAISFRHYVLKIESVSNYGFVAKRV
jgi:hypothetical protein